MMVGRKKSNSSLSFRIIHDLKLSCVLIWFKRESLLVQPRLSVFSL